MRQLVKKHMAHWRWASSGQGLIHCLKDLRHTSWWWVKRGVMEAINVKQTALRSTYTFILLNTNWDIQCVSWPHLTANVFMPVVKWPHSNVAIKRGDSLFLKVNSRGSCMKSDKLPQVMSCESVLVWVEDYKFENAKKSEGVALERSEFSRPLQPAPHLCLRLAATLATTSITHPSLLSCAVGNVVFDKDEKCMA